MMFGVGLKTYARKEEYEPASPRHRFRRPSAMHLEKAHWIIDNADLFIGEGTPIEEWCLLYKRLTRMSIGELTGESVRKDLMAR